MEMVEYRSQAPDLPGTLVQALAESVGIPVARRDSFGRSLAVLFYMARVNHAQDVAWARHGSKTEDQLEALQRSVAHTLDRLNALDEVSRQKLGIYAILHRPIIAPPGSDEWIENALADAYENYGPPEPDEALRLQIADIELGEGGGVEGGERIVTSFKEMLQHLHNAASTREWPRSATPDGGARSRSIDVPGNPLVSAFDLFSIELAHDVQRHGGRLTLDKNIGGGTAIEFLWAAAQYLPPGFIPKPVLDATGGLDRLQKMFKRGRERACRRTGEKPQGH
jgi:hypothetical protein